MLYTTYENLNGFIKKYEIYYLSRRRGAAVQASDCKRDDCEFNSYPVK